MEAVVTEYVPPHISPLNPLALGAGVDPFPVYKELREAGPVIWLEALGVWGVFRDSTVRMLFNDNVRFTAEGGTGLQNLFRERAWREPSPVQEVDPPRHTRTRSILVRILSPAAISSLKETFNKEAAAIVDAIVAKGEFDGVADFAKAFSVKVFLDAVGVPPDERDNVLLYNDLVRKSRTVKMSNWTAEDRARAQRIAVWLDKFCSRESVAPGSFGAQIYTAVDAGEIDEHEGRLLVRTFISAGTETTIAAIGQTLYYLTRHPDQWAIVRRDPGKARAAFEETLRFDPPAQISGRCAREAFEWDGVRIGKHDKVLGFIAAANRDPARWKDPDRYCVDRNVMGHLGLGAGIHGCVGQMIARLEADTLLRSLLARVSSIEICGEPVRTSAGFRGFKSLPMRVRPA
jgi:cytochrome P450